MTIKIIQFKAVGDAFKNITVGSEHEVLPKGQWGEMSVTKGLWSNSVWVMGNGCPVRILKDEFIELKK